MSDATFLDLVTDGPPRLPVLPAVAKPSGAIEVLQPKASDFSSGTDGRMRQTWTRLLEQQGGLFGWNASSGALYSMVGGKPARENFKAAALATDLVSSNPTLASIVDLIVTHGVGTGLNLSARPDADALGLNETEARAIAEQLESRFSDWAADAVSVDRSGRFDLHQLAQLALRTFALTGETFAVHDWLYRPHASTRTCVQLIDPRQVAPEVTMRRDERGRLLDVFQGVAFDRGRFVGIYYREMPLGSYVMPNVVAAYVPAFTSWGRARVSHLFVPVDPRQVRGLSPIVSALTSAHERETISEFEVVASLLQTQFGISLKSQLPAQQAAGALGLNDEMSSTYTGIDRERWYETNRVRFEPGQVSMLAPGDELEFHRNEHPNSRYRDFDKSLTEKAARAAGVEAADLKGDYSDTNFSAARIANESPFRVSLMRRRAIVERFYKAAYENVVEEWIETGAIKLPRNAPPFQENRRAYTACCLKGWGRIEPDPYRTMKKDIEGLTNGILTLDEVLSERGVDFDKHVKQLVYERKILEAAGLNHPFFPGAVSTQNRNETIEEDAEPAKKTKGRNASLITDDLGLE